MRKGVGGWQQLGQEIDLLVMQGDPAERLRIVDRHAVEIGRNPAGLRRLYEAFCYAKQYKDGLATKAPVAAIESLARIDARDSGRAAELRPLLFANKITVREMVMHERNVAAATARVPQLTRDMSVADAMRHVESNPAFSSRLLDDYTGRSDLAVALGGNLDDAETGVKHPAWILLMSPAIRSSVLSGRPINDLLSAIAQAMVFYDIVFVVVSSGQERDIINHHFASSMRMKNEDRRQALLESMVLIDPAEASEDEAAKDYATSRSD